MNTSPLQFTQDGNLPVSELTRWTGWFLDALREPGASFRSVIAKFHAAFGHRITLSTFHRFHHDALASESPDKFVRKNLRSRAAQIVRHVVEEHLERWLETPPEDLTEIERGARIVAKLDALDFQHLRLKQQKKGKKRAAKTENAATVLHPDFAPSGPTAAATNPNAALATKADVPAASSSETPRSTPPQTTPVSALVPPAVSTSVSGPVPTAPAIPPTLHSDPAAPKSETKATPSPQPDQPATAPAPVPAASARKPVGYRCVDTLINAEPSPVAHAETLAPPATQAEPTATPKRESFTPETDPDASKALAELLKTTKPSLLPPAGMLEIGTVTDESTLRALGIAKTIESLAAFHAPPALDAPQGAVNESNADAVFHGVGWAAATLADCARRRNGDATTRFNLVRLNLDGAVSAANEHWRNALEAFQQAEPQASAQFDKYRHLATARCSLASITFKIAVAQVRLGEPAKAFQTFRRAASLSAIATDDSPMGLVLRELNALAEEWLALLKRDEPLNPARENRIKAALACRQALARRCPGEPRHPAAIERLKALRSA
jgi:hypothetical protein